jgi:hypothetical protein
MAERLMRGRYPRGLAMDQQIDTDAAARVLKFLTGKGLSSEDLAQVEALLSTNDFGMTESTSASKGPTTNWADGYTPNERPKRTSEETIKEFGQDSKRRSGVRSFDEMFGPNASRIGRAW